VQDFVNSDHRGSPLGDAPQAWLGFINTCQAAIGRSQLENVPGASSTLMPALLEAAGQLRTKAERDLSRFVIFKLATRLSRNVRADRELRTIRTTTRPSWYAAPLYLLDDGGSSASGSAGGTAAPPMRIAGAPPAGGASGVDPRVNAVLRYIGETHLLHSCRLAEVATYLRVSRSHLSRLVLKETGNTFKGHLTVARMSTASRLLQETNLSIKEIATHTGYGHVPSFDRQFRQYFHGVTPGKFRRLTTGSRN
jgi:AraC-like DNA-binding protein